MNDFFTPSRVARRRAEEVSAPPRPIWRIIGSLPLLVLIVLLAWAPTVAWFTSGTSVGDRIASGTWATLMHADKSSLSFPGPLGESFTGSFRLTSLASVPLNIWPKWEGGGSGPTVSMPSTIIPGHPVTVTLTGPYADYSGTLKIVIGSQSYDWGVLSIAVTVTTRPIETVVTVDFPYQIMETGTGAPKIDVLNLTPAVGANPITVTVAIEQFPKPSDLPDVVKQVSLVNPAAPPWEIDLGAPTIEERTLALYLSEVYKGYPICVQMTMRATDPNITGSIVKYVTLAHEGNNKRGLNDPDPPPYPSQCVLPDGVPHTP